MNHVATTRLSSKGQVVIPEEIREQLHLEPGTRFIVLGESDTVILKTITPPDMSEFDSIIQKARDQAAEAGMTISDVDDAVKETRKRS